MHGFVKPRLHRRLFVWFALAMLVTALTMGGVSSFLGMLGGGSVWSGRMGGAEAFLGSQFGRVWSDPSARDRLAQDLAQSFGLRVELEDASRAPIAGFGGAGGQAWIRRAIEQEGRTVGYVTVAPDHSKSPSPWRGVVTLGVAAMVLWAFARGISRRLAWPFYQLAQVARDIGAGKLKTRAPTRRQLGEARVLAHAINEMADRIERQLAEQRELLAAVSHELRTPLARVRLLVELARSGQPSAKLLDELDQEAVEMDRLVGELLASARVEFGALSLSELDPAEIAARALERAGLAPSLLEAAPGLPRVRADATLLLRALANLLDNARRHGGSPTRLTLEPADGRVRFAVEDAGPGFAPGESGHAFQPFRRTAGAGKRDGGSLGLGLSLVERIAHAHGGAAFAENLPAGGARVGIVLG